VDVTELGKMLMVVGGVLLVIGLLVTLGAKLPWLGRLPGDIYVQRDNFSFYFPLATCLLLSALLSLILFLFRR
jgi:membrane protein implicated in regulation of membrane protease activity